jgi:hypothetical protein
MAQELVGFQFTCPLCGGHSLELPEDYNDNSMARCSDCGTDMGRWGDFKAAAEKLKPQATSTPFKGFTR